MKLCLVKITNTVVTSQYGTLESGDILRTNPAFAKHLVEECKAAKFIENPPSIEPTETVQKTVTKVKRKGKNYVHP
ncbi:MAG: hypothetical protein B7Y05_08700 [Polynucleobacter sp. 24-46-87]|nr:MAG: hypothetical protein B7Y05_08700 [Polynucleobacter sp. 24-46-87]HQR84528.1 hypothetical protein [Polynucleobacter sp.]